MKKFILIIKIIFSCLSFTAGVLFLLAYYFPDKTILLNIAYPLLAICSISLFIYSLIKIINKRNKDLNHIDKKLSKKDE